MSAPELQAKKPSEQEEPRAAIRTNWISKLINCWTAPEATGIAYYCQSLVQNDFLVTSVEGSGGNKDDN
jgi:hypothetical protein